MENTIENKQKLFAQYFYQKVFKYPNHINVNSFIIDGNTLSNVRIDNGTFLELKHTNKITKSDLYKLDLINNDCECVNIYSNGTYEVIKGIHVIYIGCLEIYQIDLLRSLGYAVEFMGVSIHQQMSYGWIKINNINE